MKIGAMGGLCFGGLLAWAILGSVIGCMVLFGIAAVIYSCELVRLYRAEKEAVSWRKNYPSYKY